MESSSIFISEIITGVIAFYNSTFFSVIKFLLGIYAVVILADIILLLVQRGFGGDMRDTLLGMNVPPELVNRKGKLRKKWAKIREKMQAENEASWKVAIIEADTIIDDLIKRMKYKGENMGERLENIPVGQIENVAELKIAHEIKNQIVQEESFQLTKEKAEEAMGYYENFLRYFEVLE